MLEGELCDLGSEEESVPFPPILSPDEEKNKN